jgi:predicted transport protein
MSDIKLFKLVSGKADELQSNASDLEKPLQTLIETNLESLLGIRFLATEYSTGKTHAGRIDSMGIDENSSPVIIEYKRSVGENVINQGLFYLDWLMDHQAEFTMLVAEKLGKEASADIDWTSPRLVCIAADFTKYDAHAVQQIGRDIQLIRYRMFGNDLLLFELANASSTGLNKTSSKATKVVKLFTNKVSWDKSYAEMQELISDTSRELLVSIEDYIISLGDDVQRKELKLYVAFKRIKNFASIVVQKNKFLIYLNINPDLVLPLPSFARDVRSVGHWATGDLELSITSAVEFDMAKQLIYLAYEGRK